MAINLNISIVLYKNEEKILFKTISSTMLSKFDGKLFIIDNSPLADLEAGINSAFGNQVIYIHNPSNPGFGASHNIAIKKSFDMGCKYHLVLNPDVYFEEETLASIAKFMDENPRIGNLMPKVLYPNGDIQFLCKLLPTPYDWIGRRFNPFKSMVNSRNELFELRFTKYNKIMEVPYLSGCFMFLRLSAIREIGHFDENIFMYGEETDLCRRLISAGYKTVFYPEATIYHHFEKGSHKSWRLTKIGIQSAIYYFNKWGWFFDKERINVNRNTLSKLGYRK